MSIAILHCRGADAGDLENALAELGQAKQQIEADALLTFLECATADDRRLGIAHVQDLSAGWSAEWRSRCAANLEGGLILISGDEGGARGITLSEAFEGPTIWNTERALGAVLGDIVEVVKAFFQATGAPLSQVVGEVVFRAADVPLVLTRVFRGLETADHEGVKGYLGGFRRGLGEIMRGAGDGRKLSKLFPEAWVSPDLFCYCVDQVWAHGYRRDLCSASGLRCFSRGKFIGSQGVVESEESRRDFADSVWAEALQKASDAGQRALVLWHLSDLPLPSCLRHSAASPCELAVLVFSGWPDGIGDAHLVERANQVPREHEEVVGVYESLYTGLDDGSGIPEQDCSRFRRALNRVAEGTSLRKALEAEGIKTAPGIGKHEESGSIAAAILAVKLGRFSDARERLEILAKRVMGRSAELYTEIAENLEVEARRAAMVRRLEDALQRVSSGGQAGHD